MSGSKESQALKVNGFVALLLHLGLLIFAVYPFFSALPRGHMTFGGACFGVLTMIGVVCLSTGFTIAVPNQGRVIVFFGRYKGTIREQGFWWTLPFTTKKAVSLRIRNFNSERLKVNDARGNPIELAAVVVWRVVDTSKALFDVDDYEHFVSTQSETALRGLASAFPYDHSEDQEHSLRGSQDLVAQTLKREVEARLVAAGVEVIEARLSHLAYAPEIAQAMLRRQQAEAVIAARQKIVEGAVGMVQMALKSLSERGVVQLDEERKAAMVNNLLVTLTAESETTPVINTGSLY